MAKTKPAPRKAPAPDLSYIAEPLRALAVPIGELKPAAKNARTHGDQDVRATMTSLERYGQRTPIVVNRRNGQIEAGHGRLKAAKKLGWTHLAVVWVEDDPATQHGYAIADNRTGELAGWDQALLDELLADVHKADPAGYRQMSADLLLDQLLVVEKSERSAEDSADQPVPEIYEVVVTCADEADQQALYDELTAAGRNCRVLTV